MALPNETNEQDLLNIIQGGQPLVDPAGYNWALQLGVSLAGASDVLTLAIRTVDSGTPQGECYGTIAFWDLTQ